jgi:hypothetical protein
MIDFAPSFRGARQREPGTSRFPVRSFHSRPGMTAFIYSAGTIVPSTSPKPTR